MSKLCPVGLFKTRQQETKTKQTLLNPKSKVYLYPHETHVWANTEISYSLGQAFQITAHDLDFHLLNF